MNVFSYTSYKKPFELYIEIHGWIAVNTLETELARKDLTLLSGVAPILHKVGLKIGIQDIHIKYIPYPGAYSIYGFKAKVKVAVLQQRQDWNLPEI